MAVWKLVWEIGLLFILLAAVFRSYSAALVGTVVLLMLLHYHRIPPVDKDVSDEILGILRPNIIAHRGAGTDAPENTIGAFREAKKNGANAIELDVEFTSDGVAILLHDETIDRTTDGVGRIRSLTYDYVKTLSASVNHPLGYKFPNERVPTLEDGVKECLQMDMKIYFDIKGDADKAAVELPRLYKKYPRLYRDAIVCSFDPRVVYKVRKSDPKITGALTHRHLVNTQTMEGVSYHKHKWRHLVARLGDAILEWAIYRWLWYLCGTSAFLVQKDDVSKQMVQWFEEKNIKVVLWTVNDPLEKKYFSEQLNVSHITDTLVTAAPSSTN